MSTWDETRPPAEEAARQGAMQLARAIERRKHEIETADPRGDPATVGVALLGRYLRRGRLLVGMTQRQLADAAGVSQSVISRAERGVAPGIEIAQFVRIVQPLARLFPLGLCPHDHNCAWQPVKAPSDPVSDYDSFARALLEGSVDR